MSTLKELLEGAKLVHDVTSGRALANLAERHGYRIDRTQVNAILNGSYKNRPSGPTLEAISFLAGVDLEVVYAAADQPLPGPPFAEELPPEADQLMPHERAAVISLIRAFLRTAELNRKLTRVDLSWADRVLLMQRLDPTYDGAELGRQVRTYYALTAEEQAALPDDDMLRNPERHHELEAWLATRTEELAGGQLDDETRRTAEEEARRVADEHAAALDDQTSDGAGADDEPTEQTGA